MTTLPTRFRRNAITNYANSFALLALALLVTPILFRGLGKDAYGTWVLVTSSVFYFDLLKFGFSRAAIKYVAESRAIGDLGRVRRVIATSCAVLSFPGFALLAASPGIALLFPLLFDRSLYHSHPGLKTAAVVLVLLSVTDMAVAIPADTFGSALMGFQRYDLLNLTVTATAIGQASAWALIIYLHGGLIAIGVATVTLSLCSQVARYWMVRRLSGGPPLRRRNVDRSLMRPLTSISGWIAITDFADVVINRIDPLVVGFIAGVPQAAVYAVGQKLASLAGRFTSPAVNMFFPHASELAAAGDKRALRESLLVGTRIALGIATPLTIMLAVLAKPAIQAWVGPGSSGAEDVVIFLAAAYLVVSISQTGILVLRGAGDVKIPARINLLEAGLNFGLSIALCKLIGYRGVALGTLIAAAITQLVILLPYICRQTETGLLWFCTRILRAHAAPVLAALALGYALRRHGIHGLGPVIGSGAAIIAVYFLVAFVTALEANERRLLLEALGRKPRRGTSERPEAGDGTRKPRLLLVDPSPRGGIALYTMGLARALDESGADVDVLGSRKLEIPVPEGIRLERRLPFDRWGKPAHAGPRFYFRRAATWLWSASAIRQTVERLQPDVVHFQGQVNRRFDARLVRRLARRRPVVWTAHDVLPFERTRKDAGWFSAIYKASDAVIVHSQIAADAVWKLAGVDASVIEQPVLFDTSAIPRAEARRRLGLPEEGRILAALGFIRRYKGYSLLAEVWEELGDDAPLLLVMGELMDERQLEVVERLRRTGRADIRLGYASDEEMMLAISASDALLLPYSESSESGLLHLAGALGVPVLASDVPQLAAAVGEYSGGLVLERDVSAWGQAVTGELPSLAPLSQQLIDTGTEHLELYGAVLERRARASSSFRLALYTDATELGGAERVLAELAHALDPVIDVTVMGVDRAVVEWVAAHRESVHVCLVPPVRGKTDLRPILAHWRAIRRLRPHVFHANLRHPYSSQYALAAALLTRGTRVVALEHLPIPAADSLQLRLKRLTSRHLAAHVSVSKASARKTEELLGLSPGTVRTIYNGVATDGEAPPLRAGARPIVGMVGRFTEQKGVDVFLRALAELPDVEGVVVGDGPDRPQLERLVDELGLRERVVLTGWRADARALIATFDVLAVPSRYEPFGLVAVEAMSAGVPVVATSVDGLCEVVVHGETGFLVPPGDVAALVEAIRRALDPEESERLGERAKVVARESFGVERMVSEYESLYRSLLE